jgi:chemotaxis protein MotB
MTSPIGRPHVHDCVPRPRHSRGWCGLVAALALAGCGASELDQLRSENASLSYDVQQTRQHNDDLKRRMRLTEARNRVLINLVRGLSADPGHLSGGAEQSGTAQESLVAIDRDLDELALTVRQSREDLHALKQEREALQQELQQALTNIEQTRTREQAASERLMAMRDAMMRHTTTEAGSLEVRVADNRMVFHLSEALLFDRGRASIRKAGKPVLDAIASALLEVANLQLQIAGHAALGNADPTGAGAAFATAWQLSAARAVNVTQYLIARGVEKQRLSAVAHGDTRPLDPDPSPQMQAVNRRVEIVLIPLPEEPSDRPPPASTEPAAVPPADPLPAPTPAPTPAPAP